MARFVSGLLPVAGVLLPAGFPVEKVGSLFDFIHIKATHHENQFL